MQRKYKKIKPTSNPKPIDNAEDSNEQKDDDDDDDSKENGSKDDDKVRNIVMFRFNH